MTRIVSAFRAALLVLLMAASAVWAQSDDINFDIWEQVAQRAETAVDSNSISSTALEDLRSSIASFRDRLLQQQSAADPRLATLQSQLDALGPIPDTGEEPAELAQRRDELQAQIAELEAPIKRAEEAYNRADGLIKEIDEIIRARQTDALLERGPEPLDPRLWPGSFDELVAPIRTISSEISTNWNNENRRTEFIDDLPAILLTLAIAILLVFRAPRWIDRLGEWLRRRTRRGTGVWNTLLSLARLALPVIGVTLVVQAGDVSGLLGPVGAEMSYILPIVILTFLLTRWLANETFSSDDNVRTIPLPQQERRTGRYYGTILAVFLAISVFLGYLIQTVQVSPETQAVWSFPLHLVCGLLLFRFGRILRKAGPEPNDSPDTEDTSAHVTFPARLARLVGQAAIVLGLLGPVLSAVGYLNVAQAMIFPTIASFGLFALLLILQRLIGDLFHLITGRELDQSQSLLPVLSGLVLSIVALPLLALIWGARVADLTELWARFQAGFTFGDTRISPTDFLTFIAVFAMGYLLTRLLQSGLRGSVLPKTRIDQGGRTAIVSGTGYLGIFLSAVIAITAAGIDLTALAFVAGALSVGIGFGLQNIVQNFVSGIILLIERPISEGDWIEVNGQHGTVRDISVRSTRIETFDRTDVIVPNADLVSNSVTNYTRGNVLGRLIVDVGVAYGTDTRKVEDILYKIARNHEMVLMNPAPFVHFKGFGADSLDFDVRMILRDVTKTLVVRTEVNHQIAETFMKEGIEIPFAQRDIWLRNPEALTGAQETGEQPEPVSDVKEAPQ
ncbi:DUF3772 domain-containing protein [Marivita sp. S6314]|uniref:DUF3772 domain-containing protein n=1 Tax=Marivita sp. S6314 TaxID=2926406 RepID=UPI001FF437FD|nr:DUF3772 domain-containing protein [Marivita sp. S6314]MCK0148888.1 DUF3772 domain-containing protein [Marivita sp. S6314]